MKIISIASKILFATLHPLAILSKQYQPSQFAKGWHIVIASYHDSIQVLPCFLNKFSHYLPLEIKQSFLIYLSFISKLVFRTDSFLFVYLWFFQEVIIITLSCDEDWNTEFIIWSFNRRKSCSVLIINWSIYILFTQLLRWMYLEHMYMPFRYTFLF